MTHFRRLAPLGLAASLIAAAPLAAQQPDSTRRDSAVVLAPIEVVGSILAPTGPRIGSGIPARCLSSPAEKTAAISCGSPAGGAAWSAATSATRSSHDKGTAGSPAASGALEQ